MPQRREVVRIQTGVRLEKRIVLVLKALAASLEMPLGELIEGIVLHAFDGRLPFGESTRGRIAALRTAYDLDLGADDSHLLHEKRRRARRG